MSAGQIQVTDKQANEYVAANSNASWFIVQQTITLNSKDVDKVARAGKTADLVKAGVVVANGQGVAYRFGELNALKPEMITEATRNARASEDRFAADSGSQVGTIRSANQGVFSITAAEAGGTTSDEGAGAGGAMQAEASLMKKVRVVATIDYYLVK